MSDEYYSQYGEDRWIVEHLNPPEKGIFVDVGAFDGVLCSNTFHFERKGWKGLLVEPDPVNAAQCRANRIEPVWCCAIDEHMACTRMAINPKDRGASGFDRPGDLHPVITMPLVELVDVSGFNSIDILSIDAEGMELEVWKSLSKDLLPAIAIIEYKTFDDPPRDSEILMRLSRDGYGERFRTPCNLILTK